MFRFDFVSLHVIFAKKSWRKIWWLLKKCLPLHSQSGSNAANKAKRNESDK